MGVDARYVFLEVFLFYTPKHFCLLAIPHHIPLPIKSEIKKTSLR